MFLLILTLFFALLVAIFAVQNAAPVVINLFWIRTQVPLVLVILGSVLAGALIVVLIALWRKVHPKRKDKAICTKPVEVKNMNSKENSPSEQDSPEEK